MLFTLKKGFFRVVHSVMRFSIKHLPIPIPVVLTGSGSVAQLVENIKLRGLKNVLVVTDKMLMDLNLLDGLLKSLEENEINATIFDNVEPNPTIENIEAGKKIYSQNNCEGIIAFGGGSPIDCAKIIGARTRNPYLPVSWMKGLFRVLIPIPPFFCVPTTAGTGSEATIASVIKDKNSKKKFVINDLKLVPKIAVLDPELMTALPPHMTSTTGMDALTHAVEAYIGRGGFDFSDECAEHAVKLVCENLENVYQDGTGIEGRNIMAMAAFYGGLAVTRTNLGYVHAIAHNVGGLYGVPHGLANAIILPYILEFSKKEAKDKLASLAVCAGIGSSHDSAEILSRKFIEKIISMNKNMNIPSHIKELEEADIPTIVKGALAEAHPLYPVPRIMREHECEAIVRKLLPK